MARVLLVRHGESEWNAAGRWQGWADPPLTELGRRQARLAARSVPIVDAVVTSDLSRARETAEIIAAELGAGRVTVDQGLRERHVGEWSGLTRAEIDERWPDWRDRADAAGGVEAPGGERNDEFTARVLSALRRAAEIAEAVLAVSHGGVIRTLERATGAFSQTVPNLGGRWFEVDGDRLSAGDAVVLIDPEDIELTIPPPH